MYPKFKTNSFLPFKQYMCCNILFAVLFFFVVFFVVRLKILFASVDVKIQGWKSPPETQG